MKSNFAEYLMSAKLHTIYPSTYNILRKYAKVFLWHGAKFRLTLRNSAGPVIHIPLVFQNVPLNSNSNIRRRLSLFSSPPSVPPCRDWQPAQAADRGAVSPSWLSISARSAAASPSLEEPSSPSQRFESLTSILPRRLKTLGTNTSTQEAIRPCAKAHLAEKKLIFFVSGGHFS